MEIDIFKLFSEYENDRDAGKCIVKYYQYGFLDICLNQCHCPECDRFSEAADIVENKDPKTPALTALLADGFSEEEAKKQIDIFEDLGIFTEFEISGLQ